MPPAAKKMDVDTDKTAPEKSVVPEPQIKYINVYTVEGDTLTFEKDGLSRYAFHPTHFEVQTTDKDEIILSLIPLAQIKYIDYFFEKPETE